MNNIMSPRERVMAALTRKFIPDRVPWIEIEIDAIFQNSIMGTSSFSPEEFAKKLGIDAIGSIQASGINLDFFPPIFSEKFTYQGLTQYGSGLIKSRADLDKLVLPDPHKLFDFPRIIEWLNHSKRDEAVFARIRFGAISTIVSMGLDNFSYALIDDPDIIRVIYSTYSKWCSNVIEILNDLPFDFFVVAEDLGSNNASLISADVLRNYFLPDFYSLSQKISKPWILHSDGNIQPLLNDLIQLGFSGLHPIDPCCMDLALMKRNYGTKFCLIGNVDLTYTLTSGTTEDVDAEVKEKIECASQGGGYILSSANSITNYCKIDNVLAIRTALEKYGYYTSAMRSHRK